MSEELPGGEVWAEVDCAFFQQGDLQEQVGALCDRLELLYATEPGRNGLILCAGWLLDAALDYSGDFSSPVPTFQPPVYCPGTYADLADMVAKLRCEATLREWNNFHVGILFVGVPEMVFDEKHTGGRTDQPADRVHYCIRGRWFAEHPEILDERTGRVSYARPVRAGEPGADGGNPVFGLWLADRLCAFTRDMGFSALVLRDGFFTNPYVRNNRPWRTMPADLRAETMDSILQFMGRLKSRRPELLTIGYSNGTSPVEEWRSQGFDLEELARSGHLDLWITQTWGGAWQDHWPLQGMGYTFQLANLLVEQAMLAETPVKHLFVIETFDAWEPWNTIRDYPEKLAWSIWAHTHAGLCLGGDAVRRCAGAYISWMNNGSTLLSAEDGTFVADTLRSASLDAGRSSPAGMVLVYHRTGLEGLIARSSSCSHGEEMDDWSGMLLKYAVPILFVVRFERMGEIRADGLIFPVPDALSAAGLEALRHHTGTGGPLVLMGQASAYDHRLRAAYGIDIEEPSATTDLPSAATVAEESAPVIRSRGLAINQRRRSLAASKDWTPLITALGGPVFARHRSLPVLVWETPEWGDLACSHLTCRTVQSLQLYQLVASEIRRILAESCGVRFDLEDNDLPLACPWWRSLDGRIWLLPGCLESGMTGASLRGAAARICPKEVKAEKSIDRQGRTSCFFHESAAGSLFVRAHGFAVLSLSDPGRPGREKTR